MSDTSLLNCAHTLLGTGPRTRRTSRRRQEDGPENREGFVNSVEERKTQGIVFPLCAFADCLQNHIFWKTDNPFCCATQWVCCWCTRVLPATSPESKANAWKRCSADLHLSSSFQLLKKESPELLELIDDYKRKVREPSSLLYFCVANRKK